MASRGVSIDGLDALRVKLTLLPGIVDKASKQTLEEQIHETAEDVRRAAPVKTGELKESVQEEAGGRDSKGRFLSGGGARSGQVAITAPYAKYVIQGTSDTEANDFTAAPIEATRAEAPRRLRVNMEAGLKAITK